MTKILRIFPTKTNATPDDELVRVYGKYKGRIKGLPTKFDHEIGIHEVHISVAFTWDIPIAEWLADHWRQIAPVKLGGPAYNEPGGDFVPGMYMKRGYVITSRGCPNRCWFCSVPKREGYQLRELPVTDGWILTDDNLLACSPGHIDAVFEMLARQPHRPQFVGGLEAALLTPEMAARLRSVKPESIYFAYDTPNDLDPLVEAGKMLHVAGFPEKCHDLQCYCLCGHKGDTFEKAVERFGQAWAAGFMPRAMLYRDHTGKRDPQWVTFANTWSRRQSVYAQLIHKFGK